MASQKGTGKRSRLLVVEDDSAVSRLLEQVLDALGYDASIASSAEEALEGGTERLDEIAGAIIDWRLPDMRGDELARRLRAVEPALPLILTSGDEGLWDHLAAELGGPVAVLGKPFSLEELRRALMVCRD